MGTARRATEGCMVLKRGRIKCEGSMGRLGAFLGSKSPDATMSLSIVHFNITIYAAGYWMQQPVLPFLSKELGADEITFGQLTSAISFLALLGGPVMGRLTDIWGAKSALIIAQCSSAVMYGLMWQAHSLPMLFASRVPALLQHAMLCAQAAVANMSTSELRSVALGRLTLSYGAGMVIGSPFGGTLSKHYGHHAAAGGACLLTCGIIAIDALFLEDHDPSLHGKADGEEQDLKSLVPKPDKTPDTARGSASTLEAVADVLGSGAVRDVLVFSMVLGLGLSAYSAMFALGAKEAFKIDAQALGFYMAMNSIVMMIGNVVLVGPVVGRLGEFTAIYAAATTLMLSYACVAMATSFSQLQALAVPISLASGILYTVQSSVLSKVVATSNAGTAMSLSHASRSACGVVAPLLGGFVMKYYGFSVLSLFTAAMAGAAAGFMATLGRRTVGQ